MSEIRTSEKVTTFSAAFIKAQAAMPPLVKDKDNPFFKSKYADLAALLDVAQPVLNENGIAILQGVSGKPGEVTVTTRLQHASGEWMESSLTLALAKPSPQDAGSAITYARRYALQGMLALAAEDDDGNMASGRTKREKPREPRSDQNPYAPELEAVKGRLTTLYGDDKEAKAARVKEICGAANFQAFSKMPLQTIHRVLDTLTAEAIKRGLIPESEGDDLPEGLR